LEVDWIFWVGGSARGTQSILVGSDPMPTKPADLVFAGARIEVKIIDFEFFHT